MSYTNLKHGERTHRKIHRKWKGSNHDERVLSDFLHLPVSSSQPVFSRFLILPGAVSRENVKAHDERFIYIPGTRKDRVLLIAHADTAFDGLTTDDDNRSCARQDGKIFTENGALGADDRAGCAILWLLKNTGHSILITDGEESGLRGSGWLMECNEDIADDINNHSFMVQLDRRNGRDFKTYDVGTDEFKKYITEHTGYHDAGCDSFTDICVLCRNICGVNFSVGYYNEHTYAVYLDCNQWHDTLNMMRSFLSEELPVFRLKKSDLRILDF